MKPLEELMHARAHLLALLNEHLCTTADVGVLELAQVGAAGQLPQAVEVLRAETK